MQLELAIEAGPNAGQEFVFDRHDSFLVGRGPDAHFQLPTDDPYFSRRHFLIEINPPRCRLIDLNSRNGTQVNGERVNVAELKPGDEIKAGRTQLRLLAVAEDRYETTSWPETGPAVPGPLFDQSPIDVREQFIHNICLLRVQYSGVCHGSNQIDRSNAECPRAIVGCQHRRRPGRYTRGSIVAGGGS